MKCWTGSFLQVARLVGGDEPCQGLLQQFKKLPQVNGHAVEFGFVQGSRSRPVDRPAWGNDVGLAATVRTDDKAGGSGVRTCSDIGVLRKLQKDIRCRGDEVAIADVRPGGITDAAVEGDQVSRGSSRAGKQASCGLIVVVGWPDLVSPRGKSVLALEVDGHDLQGL